MRVMFPIGENMTPKCCFSPAPGHSFQCVTETYNIVIIYLFARLCCTALHQGKARTKLVERWRFLLATDWSDRA